MMQEIEKLFERFFKIIQQNWNFIKRETFSFKKYKKIYIVIYKGKMHLYLILIIKTLFEKYFGWYKQKKFQS